MEIITALGNLVDALSSVQNLRLGLVGGALGTEVWKGGCLSLGQASQGECGFVALPPPFRRKQHSWEVSGDLEGRGEDFIGRCVGFLKVD